MVNVLTNWPGAITRWCEDWWRSLRAGLDPDGVMRRCAHRTDPFTVKFPGMGGVHFVATSEGAREILTLPREILTAPTPNPIEPIVGPSSVILASGDQDRRLRRMLSPAFRGTRTRRRARAMAQAGHRGLDRLARRRSRRTSPGLAGDHEADHHPDRPRRRFRRRQRRIRPGGLSVAEHQHRTADARTGTPPGIRKLSEPRRVIGLDLRAGDIVGIAVPALHFNLSIWHEPYRFDPDRFLGYTPTPLEYVPFGGGYRRCPGAAFAQNELAIAIGTVMRDVTLRVTGRERGRKPPRAVPRGIATVPHREITLEVAPTQLNAPSTAPSRFSVGYPRRAARCTP